MNLLPLRTTSELPRARVTTLNRDRLSREFLHDDCSWFLLAWCLLAAMLLTGPLMAAEAPVAEQTPATTAVRTAAADSADIDPAKLAKITESLQEFVDDDKLSGVVALVARRGKVVYLGAVGEADLEQHRPMQTDALFAIASMTKPITATAVMILKDEGKLRLEDPVSKYIPEFKQAKLKTGTLERELTIRDLMTHTSGMGGSQKNEGTLAETAAKMAGRPLSFQPGSQWQYSPGMSVCGRIIEVASGQPYEVFLAERIFAPLGMKDTTFNPTPAQQPRIAKLYQPAKGKSGLVVAEHWISDVSQPRTPNPSGGLFSTARDLGRFYQMVLNGGELDGRRIVSKESVAQMTKVQTGDIKTGFTPGNGWGLGWCIVRHPQGVSRMLSPGTFGHGGALGTQGWVDPQQQMIYVLLIQRVGLPNSDASEMRETLQQRAVDAVRE